MHDDFSPDVLISSVDLHSFGFVTPLCLAAQNLEDALASACRFSVLWSHAEFVLERGSSQFAICFASTNAEAAADCASAFAAWNALISRTIATPLACPAVEGRARVCYPRALLELPVPSANAALYRLLSDYGERKLHERTRTETTASRVRAAFDRLSSMSAARAERVARELGIGVRTLHRRLRAERTSFRQLVELQRIDLCMQELELSTRSAKQVAYGLGFADPTSFHRAFKRWTGQTVSAYRQAEAQRACSQAVVEEGAP